jgi:Serine kinase of the HPr protein, regulates carbohydrate metabolism
MRTITVEDFLGDMGDALQLKLEMGEGGLKHPISIPKVLKPGLLLTNLLQKHEADGLHADQIVVFGGQEMEFIAVLPAEARQELFKSLFEARISCLVVSRSQVPPPQMVQMAKLERIPLLCTGLPSGDFIDAAESWLEKEFQPSICKHGEMVDVYGVGIFIFGKSGIGKSECALDLVMRGHRLAADDVVRIRRVGDEVFGGCSDMIQHHMEIRGLGIINIKDLFGAASVRDTKKIDLVIELVDWDANQEYDRLGIVDRQYNLLGVSVPFLTLPVRPGRNTTTIIEVAARNHLLKRQGVYSARDFQSRFQLFSDKSQPADSSAPPKPSELPEE